MLATFIITILISTTAFAAPNTIMINGIIKQLSTPMINENGTTMIYLMDLTNLISTSDVFLQDSKVRINKGDLSLSFDSKQNTVIVDSKPKEFPVLPIEVDGKLMVPLRFVAESLGAKVDWNESTKLINIQIKEEVVKNTEKTNAIPSDAKVMSYDEALKTINSNNTQLKTLEEGIKYMDERLSDISRNYHTFVTMGVAVVDTTIETIRGLKALQNQRSNVTLNEQLIKDASELMLRTHLTAIAGYEFDIDLLEEKIALDTINYNNLKLKQDLGMISAYDVVVAGQELEKSKTNLSSLKMALANERTALNNTMKQKPTTELYVQYTPEIKTLDLELESYIKRKMDTDLTIKIKKQAIEEAEYRIDTRIDTEESRLNNENKLRQAIRELDDAKRNLDKNIRSAYSNAKQLEERQKALKVDLKKMQDNLKNMQANLQAGMVTPYDVMAVQMGVSSAEIAIKKNEYTYSNLLFAIERPYLLAQS